MHCDCLIIAHRAFYNCEPKALFYDRYLRRKKRKDWEKPDLSREEIDKLFRFIRSWDYHFQGDPIIFKRIYAEIFLFVQKMQSKKIEDLDLRDHALRREIEHVFDNVADCCAINRYESTDASKMLHTMLPDLLVMWDRRIRDGLLGDENRNSGETYAYDFLPIIQRELHEAIKTFSRTRSLDRESAIHSIRVTCDSKTLAKLADEYNYMSYTMTNDFRRYLQKELEKAHNKQYGLLMKRLDRIVKSRQFKPQVEVNTEDVEYQRDFGQLIKALNMLKKKGAITAEEWRDYTNKWREFPQDRLKIKKHLEHLLNNEP